MMSNKNYLAIIESITIQLKQLRTYAHGASHAANHDAKHAFHSIESALQEMIVTQESIVDALKKAGGQKNEH